MNITQVKKYCAALPSSEIEDRGEPHNVLAYTLGGKKFAYFKSSEPEKWRFSLRVTPERFLELTDQPGIKPARYMHRFHWVTIVKVGAIDEAYLKSLIDWSYHKVLESLPKNIQKELLA